MSDGRAAELLDELAEAISTDGFLGKGQDFLQKTARVASGSLAMGDFYLPRDPFAGEPNAVERDPDLYYTMFWRMFDKTPASMVQGLAIPLRRILAQRLFRECGEGVIIHHNVLFSKGGNITLGNGVLLNRNSMLDDRGDIEIGAYTMIAAGVTIETHTHPFDNFERPIAYAGRGMSPVSIGPNTVIGYNSVVTSGSSIGYRCIVGANSVVTTDVPDYTVVGGVPAKPLKRIEPSGVDRIREALESDPGWLDPQLPD